MKGRKERQDKRIASLLFCPQEPGYPLPKYLSHHWDIPEAQWTSDYWHPGKWSELFFLKSSSEDWNSPVINLGITYIASAISISLKLKPGKSFFFLMFHLSICLGLCLVSVAAWELPLVVASEGKLSLVVMQGLLTVVVSRCGTQDLGHTGFGRYSTWA